MPHDRRTQLPSSISRSLFRAIDLPQSANKLGRHKCPPKVNRKDFYFFGIQICPIIIARTMRSNAITIAPGADTGSADAKLLANC